MAITRAPQGYSCLYLIQDAGGADLDPDYAVPLYGWDDLGDPYILIKTSGRLRVADSDAALAYVVTLAAPDQPGATATFGGLATPDPTQPGAMDMNAATPATNPNA